MVKLAKKQNSGTELTIGSLKISETICPEYIKKMSLSVTEGKLTEMVDWSTYVTPGTPGYIHGELLHPLVSGNGVDYTIDELIPAVNTLIKKPIYKVPNAFKGKEYTQNPDNLHKDSGKKTVGEVTLVKFKNGAINFLAEVDDETYNESVRGLWPVGSIEGGFVKMAESDKAGALFTPEFINFTGYLLLPQWAPPGDPNAKNEVYEMMSKKLKIECPSKMILREQKKTGVSLAKKSIIKI